MNDKRAAIAGKVLNASLNPLRDGGLILPGWHLIAFGFPGDTEIRSDP
jgi:hypothetical protein